MRNKNDDMLLSCIELFSYVAVQNVGTRRISVMLVHLVKKESSNEYLVQNSRVFQKRLPRPSLLEGFCKGFCKCKCFANPLARRMVRYLKEKDDGGTTGGLSSAGTPHNNFCVHIADHCRRSGWVEGGSG